MAEVQTPTAMSAKDNAFFGLAIVAVLAGVVAFYWFDEANLLARIGMVIVGLAVGFGLMWSSSYGREFVQFFYQENRLLKDSLVLKGKPVHLKNIRCPVLNLYATHDHIVPPSASVPLGAKIGSSDYEALEIPAGHIGMFVSRKAFEQVPRAITGWLKSRGAGA